MTISSANDRRTRLTTVGDRACHRKSSLEQPSTRRHASAPATLSLLSESALKTVLSHVRSFPPELCFIHLYAFQWFSSYLL